MSKFDKARALPVGQSLEWHDAPMCCTMISEHLNSDHRQFSVGYVVTNWEASQGYTLITRIAA